MLASAGADHTVKLWDSAGGRLLRTLSGHASVVNTVAWSPDGHMLASGSEDGTVKLWNSGSGEILRTLFMPWNGRNGVVHSVAWSPDGKVLAGGGDGGLLDVWDSVSGKLLWTQGAPTRTVEYRGAQIAIGSVYSLAWRSDGKVLACASGEDLLLLDSAGGQLLRTLSPHWDMRKYNGALLPIGSVDSVTWSPDGKMLAGGGVDGRVKLWDSTSGKLLGTLGANGGKVSKDTRLDQVGSVAWSPDGKILASGHNLQSASGNWVGTMELWDSTKGKLLRSMSGHAGSVDSVAWSPNGAMLAVGNDDGTVKLWDSETGQLLHTLSTHIDSVEAVAWSPDGNTLASGGEDQTVKLWDSSSWQLLRTLSGHSGSVDSMAWSPDGKMLASASADQTVKLWDGGSWHVLSTLSGHGFETSPPATGPRWGGSVSSVAWSPDGHTLASGSLDKTVKLWRIPGGQLLRTLTRNDLASISSVAWSPDGTMLAIGTIDDTIELWDSSNGQLLRALNGHSGSVFSVTWSPDGKTLVSGSVGGTLEIWTAAVGNRCAR